MQVNKIQFNFISTAGLQSQNSVSKKNIQHQSMQTSPYKKLPLNFKYNAPISFRGFSDINATVPDIEFEEYNAMTDATKKRLRKRYEGFFSDKSINKKELYDTVHYQYMPLNSEQKFDQFVKFSSLYNDFKDRHIICIGRSPKWFLNTSVWMKDGIDGYDFAAFSGNWFKKDPEHGLIPLKTAMPSEKEYKIIGIGSIEYNERLNPFTETSEIPEVLYPERLAPFGKNIKQKFYTMPASIQIDMLINQNTNECRSTYFPHTAWTLYNPDTFKTGIVKDMKKIEAIAKELKKATREKGKGKGLSSFSPAMRDYRNLLNFRILDGLAKRGLLTAKHISKV